MSDGRRIDLDGVAALEGAVVVSGSSVVERVQRLFPDLIVGHQVSDVVAVLGSLNIIAAELDR